MGGDIIKADRILIIEKDEAVAIKVTAALEEAGYRVAWAADALNGLKELYEAHPDLVILSRELPAATGEDPYLRIRQASYLPIIVLGSREEAAETLEYGADAYMTKPTNPIELVARVRGLLRRKPRYDQAGGNPGLEAKDYLWETEGNSKDLNGLTITEFRLASCLAVNRGRLLDYQQPTGEVWGGKEVSLDTLHFYIRQLRHKLRHFFPYRIVNHHGVGYRIE